MAAMQVHVGSDSTAGKVGGSLFLLVFGGFGLLFTILAGAAILGGLKSWRWEHSECTIVSAAVEEELFTQPAEEAIANAEPYRVRVAYQWERDGKVHQGTEMGSGGRFSTFAAAERMRQQLPVGGRVACFVDPADGASAVLRRPRPWVLLILLFPLAFVAFAVVGLVSLWRRRRAASRDGGAVAPISARTSDKGGRGCLFGFFAIFAAAGLGTGIPFFGVGAWRSVQAKSWDAVPSKLLLARVGEHSGDDSTTYDVQVLYEYEHGGRRWRSNRYDFSRGSSSGREGKQAVVDSLTAAMPMARVDPSDPSRAVLRHELGAWIFIGLLPGLFALIGIAGMVWVLRGGASGAGAGAGPRTVPMPGGGSVAVNGASRAAKPGATAALPAVVPGAEGRVPHGPFELAVGKGRFGKLVALVLITMVWDGITGTALYFTWRDGKLFQDGCLTAFLLVFAAVGALLLLSIPHSLLGLTNPRPIVTLSSALHPGGRVQLSWRFKGAAGRLDKLKVTLSGVEHATYRRGTDTTTATNTFATLTLVEATDPVRIAVGFVDVELPADTVCSFAASRNKVVWTLTVVGEIPNWPDIGDSLEIPIYPGPPGSPLS